MVKFCHSPLTLTVVLTTLSHYRVSVWWLRPSLYASRHAHPSVDQGSLDYELWLFHFWNLLKFFLFLVWCSTLSLRRRLTTFKCLLFNCLELPEGQSTWSVVSWDSFRRQSTTLCCRRTTAHLAHLLLFCYVCQWLPWIWRFPRGFPRCNGDCDVGILPRLLNGCKIKRKRVKHAINVVVNAWISPNRVEFLIRFTIALWNFPALGLSLLNTHSDSTNKNCKCFSLVS